jgi:hypothetical protein
MTNMPGMVGGMMEVMRGMTIRRIGITNAALLTLEWVDRT